MRAIFISYRRSDSEGQAGRLFDDLKQHFGEANVFMDVAGLEAGRDFRKAIDDQVTSCGVLLSIIGKSWLTATNEQGVRRIDDPADFVQLETASALKRDIPVVPVLVQGARMPSAEQLPDNLKDLSYRNAVELTHPRWDSDVQLLIKALEPIVKPAAKAPAATSARATSSWSSSRVVIIACVAVVLLALGGREWYRMSQEDEDDSPIAQGTVEPDVPTGAPDDAQSGQDATPPAEAEQSRVTRAVQSDQPASSDAAEPAVTFRSWEGAWNLEWEYDQKRYQTIMGLKADQFGIVGRTGNGTIKGHFDGDYTAVAGEIMNTVGTGVTCPSGKQTGSFQLTLAPDGQSMEGWWDICSAGEHFWWKAERQ